MEVKDPRSTILDKIRLAKSHHEEGVKTSFPKLTHTPDQYLDDLQDDPVTEFERKLVQIKGRFISCNDERDLVETLRSLYGENSWQTLFCAENWICQYLQQAEIPFSGDGETLKGTEAAATGCEFLIARTGSILVSSKQGSGRRVFGHAPVHLVIGKTSQLVNEIGDALAGIQQKYPEMPSQVSMITGPSRTADIEKTLVLGAHGPRDLIVLLLDDSKH